MSKYLRLRENEALRLDFITLLNLINDIVDGVTRGLHGDRGSTYTDAEVLEVFQAFDTHKKGYIRKSDMIEALKHVLPSVKDDTLSDTYERADPLRSGHVSSAWWQHKLFVSFVRSNARRQITFLQFREILQGEALDYLEPMTVPDTLDSAS
jgi:hypothetical protein